MTVVDAIRAELDRTGQGAAVAVVDAHGELLAFLRTDGCPLPPITIAQNKAFTAARERTATRDLGARSRAEGFPLSYFGDPRYVGWGGGLPIVVNGQVVGGLGVSGLPEDEDIRIAAIGIAALG
jgi:glc operon protein GlcG